MSTTIFASRSENSSKKNLKCSYEYLTSSTAHISLMLCIDNCGAPTSTVLIPTPLAKMGPMVEPQAMSLRTTKSCIERSFSFRIIYIYIYYMCAYVLREALVYFEYPNCQFQENWTS